MTAGSARWLRVGACGAPDPTVAARTAVEAALEGANPALVLLFVAPSYDPTLVARAAWQTAGHAPMVGCSTSGEIAAGVAGSGRVVAVAIGGPGFEARTAVGRLADGPAQAGRDAAAGLAEVTAPNRAVLLLSEGLVGHHAQVVRGAYGVGGASVQLVGGCAGDELAMTGTWQIHGDRVLSDAIVGAAIGSHGPIGIGVGHGWRRSGEPMVVTESDGERIRRLDDEPAIDCYLRNLGVTRDALGSDGEGWSQLALTNPLGLSRPGGDEIRAVLGGDPVDGSLLCGDVPQGAMVWMMKGDRSTVLEGTWQACREAVASLGGAPVAGMVAFDCAARRGILGEDGLADEMALIRQSTGGVPVGGFYTYGEVARRRGSRGVHGATLVMLALG